MSQISEDLNISRTKLFEVLGELTKPYCHLMKQWFSYKMTKETFDLEARKIMNPEQTRLHNEFLLHLLNKCAFSNATDSIRNRMNGKKSKSLKQKRDKGGFQPADPVKFLPQLEVPPQKLQEDAQRYSVHDYFLPDQSFILGRLMLGAWELGMKGADDNAAECLVVAVQYFIKNVLTAVITMRKGYHMRDNKCIDSVGRPVANPWIRNIRKKRRFMDTRFMEFEENGDTNGFAMPPAPLNQSEIEQREAFELACAPPQVALRSSSKINSYDLLLALMIHKSTIPAHSIYSDNMERIIMSLNHSTMEEREAAKHLDSS